MEEQKMKLGTKITIPLLTQLNLFAQNKFLQLQYELKTNPRTLSQTLKQLTQNQLAKKNKNQTYSITRKGIKILKLFTKIQEELNK